MSQNWPGQKMGNMPAAQPAPQATAQTSGGPVLREVLSVPSERKDREEQRDITRLDVTLQGEQRAASKEQFDRITTYRKEFLTEPTVRQFREVQNSTRQIVDLAGRESDQPGPGDIALIISFMKALDPGSVVRETEFATAENAGGVPETVRNAYNKLVSGGRLTPEIKREFASAATSMYNSRLSGYNAFAQDYRGLIEAEGADPDAQGVRLAEAITFGDSPPPGEREAGEGEPFLSDRDKELQDKLSQAYASGATLAELQALAQQYGQTVPLGSQEELDAARTQGRGIVVTPTGMGVPDPREEMGFFEGALETVTGSERSTPEVEALPDWTTMPELNSLSVDSFQAALGTMITNPQESVAIIRAQFPGVQVRQDEKGNFILRSSADGQEYAIKPGFRVSDIPRALGGLAAFTPAGRATTAGGAAISGGLTQAGIEASQAATGGEFNAEEVLLASGGNVAGQQIGRGINAVRNARAPSQPTRPRVIPDAETVIEAGEREGVRVMTTDVRPPRTWMGRWMQGISDKVPLIGTAGARGQQQEARVAMVERLAEQYAANPASIDDVTADFIKTRGGEIAKYAQMKRDVFGQTAGAPPPVAQESIDVLDMAIGRYGRQETFAGLTQKLQGWRNDLAKARNINDVEAIRKSIGDTFEDETMRAASTALRDVVDGPSGLYNALRNDMGGYIRDQAGENAFRKWRVANGRLSDFAGDLEKTTLERILKTGNATPEEARLLLFSNKPSDVRALFRNLSPEGKERARAVVVQKLIADAGGEQSLTELSTARFTGALAKSMERIGVAFSKNDIARFTGMLRLMQATSQAERAAVFTPTGQTLLPFAATGSLASIGAYLNPILTGAASVGSLLGYKTFETPAVRNLLVSLSRTQKGSKAEANLIGLLGKELARAAPAAAAPTQATPEQQPTSTIEVR